jgi:hypothetical protein
MIQKILKVKNHDDLKKIIDEELMASRINILLKKK